MRNCHPWNKFRCTPKFIGTANGSKNPRLVSQFTLFLLACSVSLRRSRLTFAWLVGIIIFPFSSQLSAQVNGHAKVTNVSGTVLTVSNVNESFDTFEVGEEVIVMQMQDDVIGSNTGDNSSFGDLSSIAAAGLFEVGTISSVTESGGVPVSITLSSSLANTFSTGSNSSLQVITYPVFGGGGDYTTTGDITCVDWDGNVGGVIAFRVGGALTLAHDINADEAGFRGGAANTGGSSGCTSGVYRIFAHDHYGEKGEGIYLPTNTLFANGRGKLLNGGGGGNSHNAGGGGGGNFSAGGDGGPGYPNCSPTAAGLAGVGLSTHINSMRVFLGGGGGAGEANNSGASAGQDGGGIILIKADTLRTSGSCGGLTIRSNGGSASSSTQDGAGGGGAGGSIVLDVNGFDISSSCLLTVSADGGDGGDVNHANIHGGGGGGGLGAVIYSTVEPTVNVTTTTDPGDGGMNNTGGSAGSAGTGGGSSGTGEGVIDEAPNTPLPIELLEFKAVPDGEELWVVWTTATEINNDFFTIERSADGRNFEPIHRENGAGNSSTPIEYFWLDQEPLKGISYYRLRQTDFNGDTEVFPMARVIMTDEGISTLHMYPNPVKEQLNIEIVPEPENVSVTLFDTRGVPINFDQHLSHQPGRLNLNMNSLPAGLYLVKVRADAGEWTRKVMVKH